MDPKFIFNQNKNTVFFFLKKKKKKDSVQNFYLRKSQRRKNTDFSGTLRGAPQEAYRSRNLENVFIP
jgi:hypothetical protein